MQTASTGEEFRQDLRSASSRVARTALSGAQLEPFTQLDDWRGARAPVQTFGAIAALTLVGLTAWPNTWLLVAVVVLIATQQHALFVLVHEAAHYRLFSRRWLNELVGRRAGALGGISMCTYRVTHRLHHNDLYGGQDPDNALQAGYPRGAGYLARKLIVDLTGWTAPKTYAYFFGAPAINAHTGDPLRPLNDTSPALRRAARRDRWFVAGLHTSALIVIAWVWGGEGLIRYAVLWLLPLVTVLQALLRLRAVAEHGAPAGYDSALHAARTNLPGDGVAGAVVRLAFFPHHVNYHIEHHLYPAVPHYRLASLHRRLAADRALDGAEVRPFADTLRRVFAPRDSLPDSVRPPVAEARRPHA